MRTVIAFSFALIAACSGCQRKATTDSTRAAIAGDDEETPTLVRSPALAALAPMKLVIGGPEKASPCGEGMVLVEGEYCPEVQHVCKKYMDPPGRYEQFRCAEYEAPAKCVSKQKQSMRFCMDRDEYVAKGETLPQNHASWTQADKTCRAEGKRVCLESEYNFACEGEEMRPYPYGFKRDPTACNADRFDIVNDEGKLKDLRSPPGAYPRCESPFGVRDLAGNLEEFVSIDRSNPVRPAMKGAYWQPSRNFCRAAQTAHDRFYNGTETGFRCCSDAQ